MSAFAFFSIILSLAALFSFLSVRFLRLPASAGSMALASLCSLGIAIAGHWNPGLRNFATGLFERIDFHALVLHGLLAFLLFAGSLHLDIHELRRQALRVFTLATLGTLVASAFTGTLLFLVLRGLGLHLPLTTCLLFGALISPTDPVAVMDMLRRSGAPAALQTLLAGESLFNDGVGAVVFFSLLRWIDLGGSPLLTFSTQFLIQAVGGIALGLGLGFLTYRLLRMIDVYPVEILLTLALATGGYALADALHLSAPLEVVAAGLIVNSHGRRHGMSDLTRDQVDNFWALLDEIFNVVLFLLLGFALILVPTSTRLLLAGLIAIPIVLLARGVSLLSLHLLPGRHRERRLFAPQWQVLTWGGLRGALSVSLALSLIHRAGARPLLAITYTVVSVSVLLQGLTVPLLLRRLQLATPDPALSPQAAD